MKKIRKYLTFGIIFFSLLMININTLTVGIEPKSSNYEDDTLVVGTINLGYQLDPTNAWGMYSFDIINQVWEGLYAYDLEEDQMNIIPRLAADDGTWNGAGDEFTVSLRTDVTFHNGQEFNASSVEYTFDRLWELCYYHNAPIRELYFPFGSDTAEMNATVGYGYIINKTVVVNEFTVRFELNFPYVPFKSLLCFSGSFIMDQFTTEIDTYINFADVALSKAIGTGPYRITEYNNANYVNFERYDDYYRGIPAIGNIRFEKYSNWEDVSNALLTGVIDFPKNFDPSFMYEFQENLMTIVEEPKEQFMITYMGMNNDIINIFFRRAINYAVDYQFIADYMYDNKMAQMTSIIPSNMLYHKDCNVPTLDIWNARSILIEEGLSETLDYSSTNLDWLDVANSGSPLLDLDYHYNDVNDFRREIGERMVSNLMRIGIKVNIVPLSSSDFNNKVLNYPEQLNLFPMGWLADYNDPSNFINPLFSNTSIYNIAQVNDSWLEGKMRDGLIEQNLLTREQIYFDMQDYIATDLMPWVFLGYGLETGVHTAHLENFPYNHMSTLSFFECTWADDDSDWDGDNISDFDENYLYGTNPNEWDTDYDGLGDWEEIFNTGTDPTDWDTDGDDIGDWEEIFNIGTDPTNWDTDGDGLGDGSEVYNFNTDPFNSDTDGDGYSDREEIDAGSDPNDYNSIPDNDENGNSDPFANIPGFPVAFLLSVFIFISFGLVFFMKKKLKN